MGGIGSGRRSGSGRQTVEGSLRLDVRELARGRYLRSSDPSLPTWGSWSWSCGGRPSGSCAVEGWRGGITISGRWRPYDESEWRDYRSSARVVWRECRLGGERAFLKCPRCEALRLALILDGPRLWCRACLGRPYGSQQERARDRTLRREWKLRKSIGGEPGWHSPIAPKPKHMRRRTYDRIVAAILAEQRIGLAHEAAFLARFARGRRSRR